MAVLVCKLGVPIIECCVTNSARLRACTSRMVPSRGWWSMQTVNWVKVWLTRQQQVASPRGLGFSEHGSWVPSQSLPEVRAPRDHGGRPRLHVIQRQQMVSLPLHSIGQVNYGGRLRFEGKRIRLHLSVGRVAENSGLSLIYYSMYYEPHLTFFYTKLTCLK